MSLPHEAAVIQAVSESEIHDGREEGVITWRTGTCRRSFVLHEMDNTDRFIGVYLIMFAVVAIQRWVLEILFLCSCTSRMSNQNPEQAPT